MATRRSVQSFRFSPFGPENPEDKAELKWKKTVKHLISIVLTVAQHANSFFFNSHFYFT